MLTPDDRAGSWVVGDALSLGMPRTFRARHDSVGTDAVLSAVPMSKATMESQKREVDALQRLSHPSLPEVLDFGVDHSREIVWTVFRWFPAEPLQDRLLRGPVRWERGCAILRDVAHALSHVHVAGMVHRDVRPSNVFVSQNRAWLSGFHFALTQQQLEAMSQAPFGDLAYLAPEVLRDPTHHGHRADVYAFGCLAYELLSGKAAFPAAAWGERADQATRMLEWKTRTTALDPGAPLPDWLRSMVQKCSDPNPERRLPDLEALVGWLDAARGSWERFAADRSEEPELDDAPDFQTEERERPLPPPALAAPTLVPVMPTLRPPPVAAPPPRPVYTPPVQMQMQPAAPAFVQYFFAAGLGCVTALGFSAVVILFVELSNGTL